MNLVAVDTSNPVREFDEKAIRKFLNRAKFVSKKYGYSDEAEDISSEVMLRYVKNPDSKSTVEQVVIDYIRQNGRRTRGGAHRISLRECEHPDDFENLSSLCVGPGSTRDNYESFERYLKCLEKEDRVIAVLKYVWDFTGQEIGYCFGVAESRVSQKLKKIQKRISQTLPRAQKERPKMGGSPEVTESGLDKEKERRPQLQEIRTSEVEALLSETKAIRTGMEQLEGKFLEKEKPSQVESYYEARFDEWLT